MERSSKEIDVRSSVHIIKNTPFKNVYLSVEMHITRVLYRLKNGHSETTETDHFYLIPLNFISLQNRLQRPF